MKRTKMIDLGKLDDMRKMDMSNPMYVESCFKELLSSYKCLKDMRSRAQETPSIKPTAKSRYWPYLNDMLRIKQRSTQKEMINIVNEFDTKFIVNFCSAGESFRYYSGNCHENVGHTTISITPLGDMSQCESPNINIISFESSEDDLIKGCIIAGETEDGKKRAYLIAASMNNDGYTCEEDDEYNFIFNEGEIYHLFELKGFKILSLSDICTDTLYEKETGILSVFNNARQIIYSEYVTGTPTLLHAKPLFPSSMIKSLVDKDGAKNIEMNKNKNDVTSESVPKEDEPNPKSNTEGVIASYDVHDGEIATEVPNDAEAESSSPSSKSSPKVKKGIRNNKKHEAILDDASKKENTASSEEATE